MKNIEYQLNDNSSNEIISIPIPESFKDCGILIKSDYFRRRGVIMPVWKIFLKSIPYPCMAAAFWLRLCSYKKGLLYIIAKIIYRYYRLHHGIDVRTKNIGYGLFIGHKFIQISDNAIIGNNVNLSQFSTIGSNSEKGAVIGNNVYIGPSVCIVEDVNVGSNTTIGAGTIVVKDLQPNSTYVGNPARRVGENKHPEFIRNPWLL
jgi:serine O-acetyltransferase